MRKEYVFNVNVFETLFFAISLEREIKYNSYVE